MYVTKCYHCRCAGVSKKDDCKRKGLTVGILVGVFDEAVVHNDEGSPVLPAAPSYTCTAEQGRKQDMQLSRSDITTATPSYTSTRGQCSYCNTTHAYVQLHKGGETCQHFSCPVPVSDAPAQFLFLMHPPSSCL